MAVLTKKQPESRKRGLALKVNYNDGGASGGLIGYRGVCTDRIMVQNVEVEERPWCSNPENQCRQYCDRGRKGRRPRVPAAGGRADRQWPVCYESELLDRSPFKFWTGTYHSGRHDGEPIPIRFGKVAVGDIALLTTIPPGLSEQDRIVFACYMVGKSGADELGNYIESDGEMDIVLPDHIARECRYWDYQAPNKDGSRWWGSGLHRFLDEERTARLVTDLLFELGDAPERDLLVDALGDSVEIRPPQAPCGGLRARGGGEGDEHRCLKELVAGNPRLIGLPPKSKATLEHSFLSGDRVDVLFDLPNGDAAAVEVETIVPLPGAHQAAKYRTLLEIERSERLGSGHVQAILVAHRFDTETRELAKKYGIRLVRLKA